MKPKIILLITFIAVAEVTGFAALIHASIFPASRAQSELHTTAFLSPAGDTLRPRLDTIMFPMPVRHQRYKNVPIEGDYEELAGRMGLKERYTGNKANPLEHHYSGTFAGYPVQNTILVTPISETAYSIITYLERRPRFDEAYNDYLTFQISLREVYGDPDVQKEEFQSPYTKGDGYSVKALKEGKATFLSVWDTGIGTVAIKIIPTPEGATCLMITYTDADGEDLNEREKKEIIKRDL